VTKADARPFHGPPVATSPGVQEEKPAPSPVPSSSRTRIVERVGPFVAGAALVGLAWMAWRDHTRVFDSPFPLWIILVLNGMIALLVGVIGAGMVDSDAPAEDDPEMVRVPRPEWESLQRQVRAIRLRNKPTAGVGGITAELPHDPLQPAMPPGSSAQSATGRTVPTLEGPPAAVDVVALRRQTGLIELDRFAEIVLFTIDYPGGGTVETLLEDSTSDLIRMSKLLGAPRQFGEGAATLLLRLLRLEPTMNDAVPGRYTFADTERLTLLLERMVSVPPAAPPRRAPPTDPVLTVEELDGIRWGLTPIRTRR
jgi:hypothetical protein